MLIQDLKLVKLSLLFFLLHCLIFYANAQNEIIVGGEYTKVSNYISEAKLKDLKSKFGRNKGIPKKYELQILLALSHYPQLNDVSIEFIEKKVFAPLSALPSVPSMISPLTNRKYRVIISLKSTIEMERILLKNLPLNAQVGVIGHELAHILDYDQRSFSELLAVAINYGVNPAYHAWYEKKTDLRAIENGLGWELYAYSKYVRTIFGSEEREVNLSDDFYLHFNEILYEMQKTDLYNIYFQPNSINKR
ncbi:hypothetical protein HZR84_10880 [Hyphobacterium sp. CCMP332]|nr:hypothetical protein HZR84_10880 [Hyphobacterium sp. CCMP332]